MLFVMFPLCGCSLLVPKNLHDVKKKKKYESDFDES